jgi:type IV pilus assembly protein PilA
MKNQKGFTLLEVLAVVVILGIIASIIVPNIATVIENNKKDSYVATARNMIEQTRFSILINDTSVSADSDYTLQELVTAGYIQPLPADPWGDTYDAANSVVTESSGTFSIYLVSTDASGNSHTIGTAAAPIAETDLDRSDVQ